MLKKHYLAAEEKVDRNRKAIPRKVDLVYLLILVGFMVAAFVYMPMWIPLTFIGATIAISVLKWICIENAEHLSKKRR